MSAVGDLVEDIGDTIGDAFGDVIEFVGDVGQDIIDVAADAISAAAKQIEATVSAALKDPLGTLATIATAVYAPYLLPVVSAGRVVANGGDLEDALKAAAVSYVAGEAGQWAGQQVTNLGTALEYGTDFGSAQTAQLAAESGNFLSAPWKIGSSLAASGTSGAVAGALTGGDPIEMALNAIGSGAIRLGTNYGMNAAGQLVNQAGDILADTSTANEITNTAQEGEFGYGYRYFQDGTVIDPWGNYFKDNELIYSPFVSEIENTAQEGEEGFGWKFFSDGTAMSPTGEYYKDGEMVWSPYATEEVVGLTEGANLIENTAKEGETGYGWKFYDNGVAISPQGEYYKDNEVIWSPYEGGIQSLYGSDYVTEIPNTAKEGEEGYGWRYFSDGTTIDPEGRYLNAEGETIWEPVTGSVFDDIANSKLVQGAKDYAMRQITGAITGGINRSLYNALFGSSRGLQAQTALKKAGLDPTYKNLVTLGFGDLFTEEQPGVDSSDQEFSTASSTAPAELFDPTRGMTWAPQTKISGLGFAGQYINQDGNTFFPDKSQEKKDKMREELQNKGWLTDEERQQILEEQQNENQYFDYETPVYTMAPWMPEQPEQPVQAAEGGLIDHNPEFYSEGGASLANRYVKGDGDGTSDSVPAMLASGEFVIPADVVSSLGNGDNDAGAKVLDGFMHQIRKHKRAADPGELPPDSLGPLEYLAQAHKKVRT